MATETELKLSLSPALVPALLGHPLVRNAEPLGDEQRLDNTYFDTPDLDLQRERVAVRLRAGGGPRLQTVKCAGEAVGGLSHRPEWEQPAPAAGGFDFSAIDLAPLRQRLEALQRNGALVPVFETHFTRRTWRCPVDGDGAILIMLDRGSIRAGDREEPICELELELERGRVADLFGLAQALALAVALRPESASKAERGYRLYLGEAPRPVRAQHPQLTAGLSHWQAFARVAAGCIEHLQANQQGAIADDDPEYIHQMRVALRRLRSALRLFRPALPPDQAVTLGPPPRQLARALAPAREWDVVMDEILAPIQADFPEDEALAQVMAAAAVERAVARGQARSALQAAQYGQLMLALGATLHHPAPPTPGQKGLRGFAARRVEKLRQRVLGKIKAAHTLDLPGLHGLRIALKRLRYTLEFFSSLGEQPPRTRKELLRLSRYQGELGRICDLFAAQRLLGGLLLADPRLTGPVIDLLTRHASRLKPDLYALPRRLDRLSRRLRRAAE
ncbi:MAG: CHAD domain-containing protein [Betaproteobacteria bacterium]|nr:CHAD domain-containing protein [Betaproteobacteria bacterium]